MTNLSKLLKRQVIIAILEFVLWVLMIISISSLTFCTSDDSELNETSPITTFWLVITIILSIIFFIIWIVGIVNAVKISNFSGGAGSLVVFAVLPLIIAHWVSAVRTRKRIGEISSGKKVNETFEVRMFRKLSYVFIAIGAILLISLYSAIIAASFAYAVFAIVSLLIGFCLFGFAIWGIIQVKTQYAEMKVYFYIIFVILILMPLAWFWTAGIILIVLYTIMFFVAYIKAKKDRVI